MRIPRWPSLFLAAGCVGCNGAGPEPPKADPTEVVVARPTARDVTDYEEFTGHTDALRSVQIKARVTGYLLKKDFQDGDAVAKDAVLYEIDDRPYRAALESAEAMVAQGEAHRTRLAADYKRASALFQRAAIGKQEFDLISSNFAEAEADLGALKAQLDNARLNMGFTKVRAPMAGQLSRTLVDPGNLVRQDVTVLNDIVDTEELYAYFDVSADAMDRVSRVLERANVGGKDNKVVPVEVGTSVDADTYEEANRHLRDLKEDLGRLQTRQKEVDGTRAKLAATLDGQRKKLAAGPGGAGADRPEEAAKRAKGPGEEVGRLVGQGKALEEQAKKLAADVDAQSRKLAEAEKVVPDEFPYKGFVNFSENKLDAATGTLRVRGVIKNPAPASILSPGLFVRVRLPIGDPHPALLVPADAIGSDQGRSYVYVITPRDEVEYRPIEIGELFDGEAGRKLRAVRKGIAAGERFIQDSEALRRVRPGAKVKALQPAGPLASLAAATAP